MCRDYLRQTLNARSVFNVNEGLKTWWGTLAQPRTRLSRKVALANVMKHEANKEANKMRKLCPSSSLQGIGGVFSTRENTYSEFNMQKS